MKKLLVALMAWAVCAGAAVAQESGAQNELCALESSAHSRVAEVEKAVNEESNPYKKKEMQKQIRDANKITISQRNNFFKPSNMDMQGGPGNADRPFSGYVGSIIEYELEGSGRITMQIQLKCPFRVFLIVTFDSNSNRPEMTRPEPFKDILKSLKVGDTVALDGTIVIRSLSSPAIYRDESSAFSATVSSIKKL
jgi:hypothetical protein